MTLNARQECFVQNLVARGMNATAAYKAAGYSAKKEVTARNGAHELLTNPYVAARISEVQKLAAMKHAKTVDGLVADLDRLRDIAIQNGQTSAGVAAVMGQAKLLGLIVDKAEVEQTVTRKPSRDPATPPRMTVAEWEAKYAPRQ
ncbi:terminase small subunit [Phyllobacterium sp. P5_D12]